MLKAKLLPLAILVLPPVLAADPAFDQAISLRDTRHFAEAEAAFEKLVAGDPRAARAWHELGLLQTHRDTDDRSRTERGLRSLGRAAELEPSNAGFLVDFGKTATQFAKRDKSVSWANRGRDALENAVALAPENLEARDALYDFYANAPWPMGSKTKSAEHYAVIKKLDPERAFVIDVMAKTNAKDFAAVFKLCDETLAREPPIYHALFFYGRTALVTGQNMERGRAMLEKAVQMEPPVWSNYGQGKAWSLLGDANFKTNRPAEARKAYEMALKLDPGNKMAATSLERLR